MRAEVTTRTETRAACVARAGSITARDEARHACAATLGASSLSGQCSDRLFQRNGENTRYYARVHDGAACVLIVEDDLDIREGVVELVREHGFETLEAANGQEALERLRERSDVQMIVLDMMMPIMDGATFRQQQLADPSLAAIPFILLTATVNCSFIATALGASACLRKPFRPEELITALERLR